MQGLPADFDDWRNLGNLGWSWSDVLPYFQRSENFAGRADNANPVGPLTINEIGDRAHSLKRYLFDAAAELGLPRTDNMNGAQTEGVGLYQINTKDGRRWSAADPFLRPALRRGNRAMPRGGLETRSGVEENRPVRGAFVQRRPPARVHAQS